MALDKSKYLKFFFSESEELLTKLNQQLVELEKDYSNKEIINEIFRITHTIKGNAAAVGFEVVSAFAHALEDIFDKIRNDKIEFTTELANIVFSAIDQFDNIFSKLKETGNEPAELPEIARKLRKIQTGVEVEEITKKETPPSVEIEKEIRLSESVRVPLKKLDFMLNIVGEMLIDVSKLETLSRDIDDRRLKDVTAHIRRSVSDIQYAMMNIRLLSLSSVLDQFPRLVRDSARKEKKDVELEIIGGDIELDSKVIEKLKTPLIHIVRNAISHGIELPSEREKMGKPKTGKVTITAYRKKGRVQIEVSDDGVGIDPIKIAARAVEMNIITTQQAEEFTDEQINELIFEPGFTTAKDTSEVSGRGVGMDAVRSELSSIGGTISISSSRNKGTTFIMNVPLSIAVIKALLCNVKNKCMAVPSSVIDELIQVEPEQVKKVSGQPHILYGEELIPIYDLGDILYHCPINSNNHINLILSAIGSKYFGMQVDSFIREEEIVVKSFWVPGEIRTISGATILGDGKIALIIDPYEIIKLKSIKQGGE
ncbi:hypothetical protein DRQ33_04675 [bacterium]|nr:MAG: hypothetical protein DRQ33_04675 [bacterium]